MLRTTRVTRPNWFSNSCSHNLSLSLSLNFIYLQETKSLYYPFAWQMLVPRLTLHRVPACFYRTTTLFCKSGLKSYLYWCLKKLNYYNGLQNLKKFHTFPSFGYHFVLIWQIVLVLRTINWKNVNYFSTHLDINRLETEVKITTRTHIYIRRSACRRYFHTISYDCWSSKGSAAIALLTDRRTIEFKTGLRCTRSTMFNLCKNEHSQLSISFIGSVIDHRTLLRTFIEIEMVGKGQVTWACWVEEWRCHWYW